MTQISHSKQRDQYLLKIHGTVVGFAKRDDDQWFLFTPSYVELPSIIAKTMKRLKAKILWEAEKNEELWKSLQPKPKPASITVKDAIKMACLSQNAVREFLREIRAFHPWMRRDRMGAYMVRREYEAAAQWPWGEFARRWLSQNPEVGMYRKFEVEPGVWICPAT